MAIKDYIEDAFIEEMDDEENKKKKSLAERLKSRDEINEEYQNEKDKIAMTALAEKLGRAFGRIGAGVGGLRKGVDLSKIDFGPETDYSGMRQAALEKYKTDLKYADKESGTGDKYDTTPYRASDNRLVIFNKTKNQYEYADDKTPVEDTSSLKKDYKEETKIDPLGRQYIIKNGEIEYITPKGTDNQKYNTYEEFALSKPKSAEKFDKIRDKYIKEEEVYTEDENNLDNLEAFIEANAGGSAGAIKALVAKTVGREKGVLTDSDINRYGGAEKFIDIVSNYLTQKINGEAMSPEVRDNYKKMMAIAYEGARRRRDKLNNRYIKYASPYINDSKFIKETMGMYDVEIPEEYKKIRDELLKDKSKKPDNKPAGSAEYLYVRYGNDSNIYKVSKNSPELSKAQKDPGAIIYTTEEEARSGKWQ